MKKIDTTPIATNIGFPVKSGSLLFLQQAYTEMLAAITQQLVGPAFDPTKGYILYGCVATGADPGARTVSAGAVFFNGEIFFVPAVALTTTGLNVLVGNIPLAYFMDATADPVEFTDGVDRNVHQIRQLTFTAGLSGSGLVNFSALIPTKFTLTGVGGTAVTGTYPNLTVTTPVTTMALLWFGVVAVNAASFTPLGPTTTPVVVSATSKLGTGHYKVFHNIGNTKYFIVGTSHQTAPAFAYIGAIMNKAVDSFEYQISDDGSAIVDYEFEIAIMAWV